MTDRWRGLELLTPAEMAAADRRAIDAGPLDGYGLMRNAGAAIAAQVLRRFPGAPHCAVLAGPGNNGGDGYVVARLLHEAGMAVQLYAAGAPRAGSDAALAARDCPLEPLPLDDFHAEPGSVVIDALYGAGLTRGLEGAAARAAAACRAAGSTVVAVDLPSGVNGETGQVASFAFRAGLTITFARLKPGHLLYPGRTRCGEIVVADIGISDRALRPDATTRPQLCVNRPALWVENLTVPDAQSHKYRRGHVAAFSGGVAATGAARLSALAAARIGAGAVTMLSPGQALSVNASHLTSIMLARVDDTQGLDGFLARRRVSAAIIGPGFGDDERLRAYALSMLAGGLEGGLVLDADAFTAFAQAPDALFAAAQKAARRGHPPVLTPHEGEFGRLFPDLAQDGALSKQDRARAAAARAHGVVIYKGPDTVIAAPSGAAAINENGAAWLATAGSGDVLAGMVAGLLAQGWPAFEAACAAVWMHADAATRFGPGLIAEDLPDLLPAVLRDLLGGRL